ncbi:MAG: Spy/CpxP family protein refolding chaperone [Polaromonas sp.]
MKFAFNRSASLNSLVLAGLLATVGAGAMAQTPPAPPAGSPPVAGKPAGPRGDRMERHDPAKMQAMMARHQAEMKAKLKITPAQEGAWTAYTTAMQPPAHTRPTAEQRAEFAKLTTPQRIDKMKEMRTQRMGQMNAAMDKRGEATKALYAALTPEQQKTFDAEHKKHEGRDGRHGEGRMHKG